MSEFSLFSLFRRMNEPEVKKENDDTIKKAPEANCDTTPGDSPDVAKEKTSKEPTVAISESVQPVKSKEITSPPTQNGLDEFGTNVPKPSNREAEEAVWSALRKSLAELRKPDSCDIVLVCDDKEFFAHKAVLVASSTYFQTLLSCGKEDTKKGKIVMKDITSDTMDSILDFIYLGTTEKLKTEDQIKNALEAAHMMDIKKLFDFCCHKLGDMLSSSNLPAIKGLADKFHIAALQSKIVDLSPKSGVSAGPILPARRHKSPAVENIAKCLLVLLFLFLTSTLLKDFSKSRHSTFTTELLSCINRPKSSQHQCFKALLKDPNTGKEINSKTIRTNGTGLLHFEFKDRTRPGDKDPDYSWNLTYFSDHRNVEFQSSREQGFFKSYWKSDDAPVLRWNKPSLVRQYWNDFRAAIASILEKIFH